MIVPDKIIWSAGLDGQYSAKLGFHWLMHKRDIPPSADSWLWIWKIRAAENVKFFVWLACHQAVPTLSVLHHRGMSQDSVCSRCCQDEETFLHCVCDCTYSKSLWEVFFGEPDMYNQMDLV